MHVVAVTRWGSPLQDQLPELAARLGMVAYDCRLRLAGGLPVVFALVDDGMEAAGHVEFLRARGHGAVACDVATIPRPEHQLVPVDFEPTATALHGTSTLGHRFELSYANIVAMVQVACLTSAEKTVTTEKKKFSPARAVLSGGMMLRKKVNRVEKTVTDEEERILYVFCRSKPAFFLWKELTLSYEGLGDQRQLTTAQNFQTLTGSMRALAPQAFYDERLLTQKRRADILLVGGGAKERRIETSNASGNDLAAFLLVRAFIEAQL